MCVCLFFFIQKDEFTKNTLYTYSDNTYFTSPMHNAVAGDCRHSHVIGCIIAPNSSPAPHTCTLCCVTLQLPLLEAEHMFPPHWGQAWPCGSRVHAGRAYTIQTLQLNYCPSRHFHKHFLMGVSQSPYYCPHFTDQEAEAQGYQVSLVSTWLLYKWTAENMYVSQML